MRAPSSEAKSYLENLNRKVRPVARAADSVLAGAGCSAYVKTIYIGYEIDGEMVAALYGHANFVEVALALDEQPVRDILVDASHLTWRTLPVAAILKTEKDISNFKVLVHEACKRIREGKHEIHRDNEFFKKSHRERHGR